jgi:precorrin-3B C17-methyltransferase
MVEKGLIYLVGVGPGTAGEITLEAVSVLQKVQVIIGSRECLRIVRPLLSDGQEVIDSHLSPLERSCVAVEKARIGQNVAIASAGDPGIYAIASTFLSYLRDNNITIEVKVIPGLTLASYAAARLGSPLGGDLINISLADQGTPWNKILRRLKMGAAADLVIVIYNPIGKLGSSRLEKSLNMISRYRKNETPVGILSQAGDENTRLSLTTLDKLNPDQINPETLIIIGNSRTVTYEGHMVTPRNYVPGVGY